MKEVFEKCYFCHADLRLEYSQTSVHGHPKYEYAVKHTPSLACTKCTYSFDAESYQYEKTNAFIAFLESIGLKKAEIEYKDMIRYVDEVLEFEAEN